ncbi:MAG: XrtA system polysaccharide deacetylase [Candidatus Latescibacterota bacterium]|nr:XrtA system polysaccharide deacetylase [Candidatus Latescibacterota bacterium]
MRSWPDPSPTNAFTVDFEDWYHGIELDPSTWPSLEKRLEVGTLALLELLQEQSVTATFFILGDAAEQHPDLVREIAAQGHEIGTHGTRHQFVYNLGKDEFRKDVAYSLEILGGLVSGPIYGHRAPYFSITEGCEWAFEVLQECGIRYDSSVFPVKNYRYGIPGSPRWRHHRDSGLVELPPTTWRFAGCNLPTAGGAYFRLFPYTLSRFGLTQANAEGHPGVFYIHPWELDPDHPRLALPYRVRVPHYYNLRATRSRLRRLLSDVPFTSASEVLVELTDAETAVS